ncbi:MAG: sulfatase-like hydrolase/transferase [Planctomycetaceae bacterium]
MVMGQSYSRIRATVSQCVFILLLNCPLTAQAWQAADSIAEERHALQSPLLRGLQNTVDESEFIQQSGADSTLLEQLRRADGILADARSQNRYAFRLMSRQARVGVAANSPNILLITVDRLALGDPGCYGQKTIQTPRIDELAREGLSLRKFYSAGPGSQAARWSLLTGQMQHRMPRNQSHRFRVNEGQVTLADALWKAGYLTAFFGLWMNGDNPQAHGFENWSGFHSAKDATLEFPESIHVDAARVRILKNTAGGRGVSSRAMLASELRSWLLNKRRNSRQFFVHFSVSAFADLDAGESTRAISTEEYRRRVERADHFVGQILDTLQATGLARRTCVVLTAENGPHRRCHEAVSRLGSLGDKRVSPEGLCDGNLQVPCIVRWPDKVRPGDTNDRACAAWDLLPTFLSIAVARDRAITDGVPFVAMLRGQSQKIHPLMYWESGQGGLIHQAAWKNGWKAFKPGDSRRVQLYRSSDDPAERVDRSAEFPDVLAGLIKR